MLNQKNVLVTRKYINNFETVFHRDEVKALFDYYKPCTQYRLAFMIMATCGLRESEVTGLFRDEVVNGFIKYRVRKSVKKVLKSGVIKETQKVRIVEIKYQTLLRELTEYIKTSSFMNNRLFSFHQDQLKRQFKIIRTRAGQGKLLPIYNRFLDKCEEFINGRADMFHPHYRLASHKLRHFYNTFQLWTVHKGNIILSAIDIGHTHINTNMIYTHSPESIGLSKQYINKNIGFDRFLDNCQYRLTEFF